MIKIKGYFFSLIIAFLVSIILLCVISAIFAYTNINDRYLQSFITGTVTLSSLIGSVILTRKIKERGMLLGIIFGVLYFLLIYFINVISNSGFFVTNTLLVYLGVCALSGMIGGIIGVNV